MPATTKAVPSCEILTRLGEPDYKHEGRSMHYNSGKYLDAFGGVQTLQARGQMGAQQSGQLPSCVDLRDPQSPMQFFIGCASTIWGKGCIAYL